MTLPRPRLARLAGAAAAAAALLAAGPAAADRRAFTETYDDQTQSEGETELEWWIEQAAATFDDGAPQRLDLRLAIEHGITRRWDVALFTVLDEVADDTGTLVPLGLRELRLRTRYRFAEAGELPVDLLVIGEAAKAFGAGAYDGVARIVAARQLDRLELAVNAIGGITFGPDVDDAVIEVGWAAGVSYELVPELRLGVESWGGLDVDEPGDVGVSVGPALGWSPATSLWVALGAGFGVAGDADELSVRAILGIDLM